MVRFGQIVIGPPGSGKTTYCQAMSNYLTKKGRPVAVINLDPANENFNPEWGCSEAETSTKTTSKTTEPSSEKLSSANTVLSNEPSLKSDEGEATTGGDDAEIQFIDVKDLITVEEVMEAKQLGPNGALMFSMQYLADNLSWLLDRIAALPESAFLLIDFPGQVELLTNSPSIPTLLRMFENQDIRVVSVHLVDSFYCADPAKFIAVLLASLSTMVHLATPHVNVLSKIDIIKRMDTPLPLPLDAFTQVMDLNYLIDCFPEDPFVEKHRELSRQIAGVIEDYSLVSFIPLNIQDPLSLDAVLAEADKANGYCYGPGERTMEQMVSSAANSDKLRSEYADYVENKYT